MYFSEKRLWILNSILWTKIHWKNIFKIEFGAVHKTGKFRVMKLILPNLLPNKFKTENIFDQNNYEISSEYNFIVIQ